MNHKLDVELSPELEVYRDKIEGTIKPYIEVKLTDRNEPTWWQSKFGGLPYLPKGFEYPKSFDGEYLYLLAQINFAEVPHLEDFPDRGILQFYIAADAEEEFYGLDFDNPTKQDKFRIIYFVEVDLQEDNLITDFSFLPTIKDEYLMPFTGCCALNFEMSASPLSINDYQFTIFDFDDVPENIWEQYEDLFYNGHSRIGGNPAFTQDDPRSFRPLKNQDYILLLQINSESNEQIDIMWGDVGIGNFFIQKSDLKKLDFSAVLYNWDCSRS